MMIGKFITFMAVIINIFEHNIYCIDDMKREGPTIMFSLHITYKSFGLIL